MEKIKHRRIRFTARPSLGRKIGRMLLIGLLFLLIFAAMGLLWYNLPFIITGV